MAKLTLTDPTAGYNSSSVVAANNALVEAAIENTISRDGTAPNTMEAALDLNSNKINNLADGTSNQDAVTVAQLNAAALGTVTITAGNINAESSTDGYVLTSDGAGNTAWEVSSATAGSVPASAIDAEASTDGYVLTSDGAGNAAWETISVTASLMNAEASTDGQVLTSDGAGNVAWEATGTGDIAKVGTPVNNQMAVWTGDGTLEGEADVTYDSAATELTVTATLVLDDATTVASMEFGSLIDDFQIGFASNLNRIKASAPLALLETSAAAADEAAWGQVWVKNTTPNQLWFTDDTGVDTRLGLGASGGDAWSDVVDAVITPDADGTRDLGLTGTRFATAYVDALDVTNNIVVAGTVDGVNIGDNYANWNTAYGWGDHASGGYLTTTAWSDVVDAVITPDADGTRDLAATATRFATAYVDNLDVTTNIVVGGTVDGRDLATDGSKLDAIEAAADVTDTANVTAAGALMDSEVDIDIKTLLLPANTTISNFGRTLIDDADAAAARTTLGIDAIAPAFGEMTINGSSTATVVSVSDTYVQVVADWITGDLDDVTFTANELIVGTTGTYLVQCSFSFTGATNDTFTFALAKNDTAVTNTEIQRKTAVTDVGALSVSGIIALTATDAVQLYGKNNADTDNFTVTNANFTLVRIG